MFLTSFLAAKVRAWLTPARAAPAPPDRHPPARAGLSDRRAEFRGPAANIDVLPFPGAAPLPDVHRSPLARRMLFAAMLVATAYWLSRGCHRGPRGEGPTDEPVPESPAPAAPEAAVSYTGVWTRGGSLPMVRVRQSGMALAGQYAAPGGLSGLHPITGVVGADGVARFTATVGGRRCRFMMVPEGEGVRLLAAFDLDGLIDDYGRVGAGRWPDPARDRGDRAALARQVRYTAGGGVNDLGLLRRVGD